MRGEMLFLLRLWRHQAELETWYGTLEDLRTREKVHFTGLEALLHYLESQSWQKSTERTEPLKRGK